mmetsp:Transcript_692/g.1185  ORF Transcript_692/g.1185 Transcript_692/m.1185 type:complete len:458 (+) Transcript_692:52-1425(+)|eukprot:CAMPEP_0197657836 /NCGR_PEP_ID=MMETSP1338-20131121/44872_1 /TAXON_ID=43686 ORGANISM="Pelagodinium beii, Strain RCC1491" /NCGR_SAMPLE_ID=MMETSP1338 /ASSEMBLY_ACC=CAM_ASM_000754 /LENGTH=457 /DNA_ID=CAMNT_0043234297 /DNA_START=50 /DNA_END=1423 /DNA_ORIENTATION=-
MDSLKAEGKVKRRSAQEILERRAQLCRWRTEHSAFSVLNLDFSPAFSSTQLLISSKRRLTSQRMPGACRVPASPERSQAVSSSPTNFRSVRETLLSFRCCGQEKPFALSNFSLSDQRKLPEPAPSAKHMRRQMSMNFNDSSRKTLSPAKSPKSPAKDSTLILPTSPNAYRVGGQSLTPDAHVRRHVQGLLNKVCPENVASIVEQIATVEVQGLQHLEIIIELIFRKAITEPHYCETYADLVFSLKSVYPEFKDESEKPVTFKGLVLNICQNEFEELLAAAEAAEKANFDEEEKEQLRQERRHRMRANMKFVGHLFLRQLLSAKVIGSITYELLLFDQDMLPEEHALDCACELILAVGFTMESMPSGRVALKLACERLQDLKLQKLEGKSVYSKRIQFLIQDILETRAAGWTKKVFQSAAKTKEEIRLAQQQELSACGKNSMIAEHVVTGQRPLYMIS